MLDRKKAYFILGLDESASDEELEKRYSLLARRQQPKDNDGASVDAKQPTMEEINEAYNFIRNAAREEYIRQQEPKNKTIGRIAHIYEYYRWHIIGSIAAIVLVVYMVIGIIDSRQEEQRIARADAKITLFWNYSVENVQPFEDVILAGIPEWKDIHLVEQYAPLEAKDQYDISMQQKAMVTMAAEKSDVYIMDKTNFELYGWQGTFLNLQDQPAIAVIPEEKRHSVEVEDEGIQWVGVDISDSPALKSLNMPEGEYYAGVRVNANKVDNALKALEWLSKP